MKQSAARLSCERGEKLLRNEKNSIVTFSHKDLKGMTTDQVTPVFPPFCRCKGIIRVSVLIDTKGKVKCVNTVAGNPLLRASAMQAAKKRTFNPIISNGKAFTARGTLVFEFSSDGQVTY